MERTVSQEDSTKILADLQTQLTISFIYIDKTYNSLPELFTDVSFAGFCSVADNIRFLYEKVELMNGSKLKLPLWYVQRYSHLFEKDDTFLNKLI